MGILRSRGNKSNDFLGIGKQLVLFTFFFLQISQSQAHEIRPAYLEIVQTSDSSYSVLWKVPTLGELVPLIQPYYPAAFVLQDSSFEQLADAAIRRYTASYTGEWAGSRIGISRLEETLIDALVQLKLQNQLSYTFLLQSDQPVYEIPSEPDRGEVFGLYLKLGIEHILIGFDHLLFVLGLILLISNLKTLITTVTSFTLAHSITLGIASVGWFSLPQAPVEAVIALSILFLAKEYMDVLAGKESLSAKHPGLVAFIFGLLHGFGFAGALKEIGFPQADVPLALFSFNVGVELGQLLFVGAAYLLIYFIKQSKVKLASWMYKLPPYVIGSMAAFWLVQRVWGFWGLSLLALTIQKN